MAEATLFQERHDGADVEITTTRARIGATTYAVKNITSVTMAVIPAQRAAGVLIALLAVLLGTCSSMGVMTGSEPFTPGPPHLVAILGLVLGVGVALAMKPRYVVRLQTSGKESDALVSQDSRWIQRVTDALNAAIAA